MSFNQSIEATHVRVFLKHSLPFFVISTKLFFGDCLAPYSVYSMVSYGKSELFFLSQWKMHQKESVLKQ